jgi:hypothetical protein
VSKEIQVLLEPLAYKAYKEFLETQAQPVIQEQQEMQAQ